MRTTLMPAAIIFTVSQIVSASGPAQDATPAMSPRTADAVARAEQAIGELQTTLVGRLKAELGRGGPRAAVTVCRDEAQEMTTAVGAKYEMALGRTSHLVRNPVNAPRPWTSAWVASYAGTTMTDARSGVFELAGDRIGVLRPIGTMDLCVMCHGPRETVQATIGDVLTTAYPDDRAVGFAPGDLRGWFWAEVPLR